MINSFASLRVESGAMKSLVKRWQDTYYCGIWALRCLDLFPAEVQAIIVAHLQREWIACWRCLEPIAVRVNEKVPTDYYFLADDHDHTQPHCNGCAHFPRIIPDFARYYPSCDSSSPFRKQLARSYGWLALLNNASKPSGQFDITWQQRLATILVAKLREGCKFKR